MTNLGNHLNEIVKDEDGVLWRVIDYCPEPTVTLERVGLTSIGREQLHIATGSRIAATIRPLGKEATDHINEYHKQLMNRDRR